MVCTVAMPTTVCKVCCSVHVCTCMYMSPNKSIMKLNSVHHVLTHRIVNSMELGYTTVLRVLWVSKKFINKYRVCMYS